MSAPLLSVEDLGVEFLSERDGAVRALDGVSLSLASGESLALLGESGCGKSVTLRSILRLHDERRARIRGRIVIAGQDVLAMDGPSLRALRGGAVSMVFQEPGLAFDPVFTIGRQIAEAVLAHNAIGERAARLRALELLDQVRIPQAARRLDAYPHELSGGMKQRAMIALALACRPRLLLADEPTTALDATVQMQILLLLRELQRETGLAIVFVTHDVGAAVEVADRVAVMYAGRVVEDAPVERLLAAPRHPYSQALLAATVATGHRGKPLPAISGNPPDLRQRPAGCAFAPRCGRAGAECGREAPPVIAQGLSRLACWRPVEHA